MRNTVLYVMAGIGAAIIGFLILTEPEESEVDSSLPDEIDGSSHVKSYRVMTKKLQRLRSQLKRANIR